MPQRAAFERAKRFLWYRPARATVAVALTPLNGFLVVVLLTLIGLLLDLAVNRGFVGDQSAAQHWTEASLESNTAHLVQAEARQGQGLGIASLAIRAQGRLYGAAI